MRKQQGSHFFSALRAASCVHMRTTAKIPATGTVKPTFSYKNLRIFFHRSKVENFAQK